MKSAVAVRVRVLPRPSAPCGMLRWPVRSWGCLSTPWETEIIAAGVGYLRIEGAFYCGIGLLFLLYGFYRAVKTPGNVSGADGAFSLGTRVACWLTRCRLIPALGVTGIWMSVPIGWALADAVGVLYYYRNRTSILAGG